MWARRSFRKVGEKRGKKRKTAGNEAPKKRLGKRGRFLGPKKVAKPLKWSCGVGAVRFSKKRVKKRLKKNGTKMSGFLIVFLAQRGAKGALTILGTSDGGPGEGVGGGVELIY